jgi:hypothetical protein
MPALSICVHRPDLAALVFGNCSRYRVQLKFEQSAAIFMARAKMRFPQLLICSNADCDADLTITKSETSDSSQKAWLQISWWRTNVAR